jgi:outer membrane receptor protein involved in Fe transport
LGTYNYLRDRGVEVTALGYGTLNGTAPSIEVTKGLSFSNIISPETIDRYNLTLTNIPSQSIDYKGKVVSNAGYVMLDNKFSDKLKLTWGARVEKYKQTINTVNRHQTYDNTDVLPSLLLTYSLNNKTNLRLAGSQSVNRPEFRELADYRVYDYENYIIVVGNPALVRSKITNADLKYEFFPSGGEILSVSAFYKNFANPIEQINAGNDVYSFQNAKTATTYGAELELRKKLNFINGNFFNNLTAYANAAYIKGNVKFKDDATTSKVLLQGQSPYLINGGLTYSGAGDNFSVTALYNKIGPRLRFRAPQGGALNIYEKPRDLLDLQITKRLSHNRLEARLTISDLLAQSYKWYYKFEPNPSNINFKAGEDRIVNSYRYGTTTSISIRYNLK